MRCDGLRILKTQQLCTFNIPTSKEGRELNIDLASYPESDCQSGSLLEVVSFIVWRNVLCLVIICGFVASIVSFTTGTVKHETKMSKSG